MATIYARRNLGVYLRFGNNLSKMCPVADFIQQTKFGPLHQITAESICIGEQIFFVVMELLDNSHIYARKILGICLRFGNNLSKMCPFADFQRLNLDLWTNLQNNHCIGANLFGGNGAPR